LQAELTPWVSSKHNMGMAFNRSVWQEIRQCAEWFCNYDDYNWDWSLQKVSQSCMSHKLHAVVMRGPRVFHVGEWCQHFFNIYFCLKISLSTTMPKIDLDLKCKWMKQAFNLRIYFVISVECTTRSQTANLQPLSAKC
jgi:N-acetylglucosaminyltransferase II (MGAT2)